MPNIRPTVSTHAKAAALSRCGNRLACSRRLYTARGTLEHRIGRQFSHDCYRRTDPTDRRVLEHARFRLDSRRFPVTKNTKFDSLRLTACHRSERSPLQCALVLTSLIPRGLLAVSCREATIANIQPESADGKTFSASTKKKF